MFSLLELSFSCLDSLTSHGLTVVFNFAWNMAVVNTVNKLHVLFLHRPIILHGIIHLKAIKSI